MTAQELRIGNLVECFGTREVIAIKKNKIKIQKLTNQGNYILEWVPTRTMSLEPLPITEQWLSTLGFFIIETNKCVEAFRENFRYSIKQVDDSDQWFWCDGENVITNLKYLHQLQNLYFSLTGEELDLLTKKEQ